MEIILKQDVENLGHKYDIVSVRPGYANNYLFPNGLATLATVSARKVVAENIRQSAHKEQKLVDTANALVAKLSAEVLEFVVKANNDKIYGSITASQIADALEAKGIVVDRKIISVETIKTLGEYTATVKLYKAIKGSIAIKVVAESSEGKAE